ncbi:MAG: hypothetical protein P4L59_00260 [Desulfosporosinus sp.]|nr:hypothetical protein [Desulfosporosinus sp.]
MYKNQYIICNNPVKIKWDDYDAKMFNGFHIYHSTFLDVTIVGDKNSQICALGYIIDPFSPQKNNKQILEDVLKTCDNADKLIINLQKYSGRYVVLYKNDRDFIIINDACSMRQIYYTFFDGQAIFTSSPKMFLDVFDYKWLIGDLKKSFIDEKLFAEKGCMWFGDECLDDRLMKVLPNHYINMVKREVLRTPLKIRHFDCEDDVIKYASDILQGTMVALNNRYKIVQAITAGWDTRIILAASKPVSDSIEYFTFTTALAEKHSDYIIPRKLANSLKINYKSILPGEVNQEFREFYSKHHIFPRFNYTLRNVQYHSNNNLNKIHVSGMCSEIVRSCYCDRKIFEARDLYEVAEFPENPYVSEQFDKWFWDAKGFSEEYGIPIIDLFYWENRMGNWGALFALEQDIANEQFVPFNNKEYLLAISTIDIKKRSAPNYVFFKKLVYNMWPETLDQPINPEKNIMKTLTARIKAEIKFRMNDRTIRFIRKVTYHSPF